MPRKDVYRIELPVAAEGELTTTRFELTEDTKRRLEEIARQQGLSVRKYVSSIINEKINQVTSVRVPLDKEKKK